MSNKNFVKESCKMLNEYKKQFTNEDYIMLLESIIITEWILKDTIVKTIAEQPLQDPQKINLLEDYIKDTDILRKYNE